MGLTRSYAFAVSLLLLTTIGAAAQEPPPPGSIELLPGYHHSPKQGIDSRTGTIWKDGALKIQYDIGEMAGNYANCAWCGWTKGAVWRKRQIIGGHEVECIFTKEKRLIVSFPDAHANFYATIRTQDEMTDMLLMVLTFSPSSRKGT